MGLYDDIKNNGWTRDMKDNRSTSVISILNHPEKELQNFALSKKFVDKINAKKIPPFLLIDGHHRLACAIVCKLKLIPVITYTLMLKENYKRG